MLHQQIKVDLWGSIVTFFYLVFYLPPILQGQINNLGLPYVEQYTKQNYQGGTQNWDFAQDEKGNIYVANNEGLLTYDGTHWHIYPLPNHTIVRSLNYDSIQKRLYVGGQDAFGYFASIEDNGSLQYIDCKDSLPEDQRQFTDVWDIALGPEKQVFFQSANTIFELKEDTSTVHSFTDRVMYLGKTHDQIIIQELGAGLKKYKDGSFVDISGSDILKGKTVVAICEGERVNESWIVTIKDGIYHLEDQVISPYPILQQSWLENQRVEDASITANGFLAMASSSQGLILVDLSQKRIHRHLDKQNGLQQNHLRAVFVDQNHDLWMGLDNGIDFVDLHSAFSRFIPDIDLESTTYTVKVFHDLLYVGNSNGLYVAPWKAYYDPIYEKNIFKLVEGSAGQVWNLEAIDDRLWLGHDEGAFLVDKNQLIPYSEDLGYWEFLTIDDHDGEKQLIAGNYFGLRVLDEKGRKPSFVPISDLEESARIIAKDKQQIWISHPYRGVYRVDFSAQADSLKAQFYGQRNGLPSDLENYVFSIFGELLVCAEKGVYRYDETTDSFYLHPDYTSYFPPDEQFRRLVADDLGNLWYISSTEAGLLNIQQNGLEQIIVQEHYPEIRSLLVGGFEYVYPFDENHVFFGAEKGVVLFDPHKSAVLNNAHGTQITKVLLSHEGGDQLQWTGQFKRQTGVTPDFSAHEHNFKFEFTTPVFGELSQVEYQYYLEGLEDNYGAWTKNTVKEYTNLPPGSYTFRCRSRINQGEAGTVDSFSFAIAPPWYLTNSAFAIYSLLALFGFWLMIQLPRKKFAKEKAEMVQQQERQVIAYEQEVQASEQTIDQLKTEKYRSELAYQSKELASLTMYIVQKNELISRIGSELGVIKEKLKSSDQKKLIRPLERLLTEDEIIENDWEQFVYHFDQVHSGFFHRLREQYPQLTPKDHKLCAYLRMNLSTKDIAPLLNISVRGVEISRYRLRRKMELPKNENLVAYMMNF